MIKHKELSDPASCLNKAEPDEPVFVIRAKDPLAAATIRHWVAMAYDVHEPEKRAEAEAWIELAEDWRNRTLPEVAAK